ncbi:hypothetical protein BLA23254_06077 [Burkholderia lata]|uniref:Uncharacterized protein n=1 Tax=Burkholderia lata (strain ATCC 17760 / DSM 23089 / LMG 22485 / NCIMB 9086 / R18194 / 383) TaxID=482957 RepID=A0A6P2R0R7_BURL3|nr:hypothetical protein BLA23254_06077 [Burkholderia lata]
MENSPLDPVETRYEAAKRARDRMSPPPDACASATFIRRTGRSGTQAGRSVGKTQDGTSDSGDAPGTDATADWFVGGVSGSRRHRAVLSCEGTLRTPRCGRDAFARTVRWNRGVPVARDIAARRAFYPGRGGSPWNRAKQDAAKAGMGTARFVRYDNGADLRVTGVVRGRLNHRRGCAPDRRPETGAGTFSRSRFGGRLLRTPASSRSDRRPGARRRR